MYNQLCIAVTAHLHNSKLLLNELDKGQEVLPVQAILVQLRRRFVGGEQDEGAVLTQAREQLQHQPILGLTVTALCGSTKAAAEAHTQAYKPNSEPDAAD